ncbi:hypothetical protein ABFX02_06G162100 [Erythranthe guttata]
MQLWICAKRLVLSLGIQTPMLFFVHNIVLLLWGRHHTRVLLFPQLSVSLVDGCSTTSTVHVVVDQFRSLQSLSHSPWYLPRQQVCEFCGAFRFYREVAGFCCASGQISLPRTLHCPLMWFLFTDVHDDIAIEFRRRVRSYNNAFAFTSAGMKVDEGSWLARAGIYAFKVHGQVSHILNAIDGSANLTDMLQLFFLDTAENLSIDMLKKKDFRRDIMALIIEVLANNPYATFFKRLGSWEDISDAYIVLRSNSVLDQINCNIPTADQVAAVWKDGGDSTGLERDIRVFTHAGQSRKISYYYGLYDPLQYPLLFTHGECWVLNTHTQVHVSQTSSKVDS